MAAPPEGKQEHEREKLATEEQNGAEEENGEAEEEGGGRGREPSDVRERMQARILHVVIEGNTRTRDSLIEAEVLEAFRPGSTEQEFVQAATARLLKLNLFHSVEVTPVAGPPELPDTTNVVIMVVEDRSRLTGSVGVFTKSGSGSQTVEGSLMRKNLFGYGDIWDASGTYGWDQATEMSLGLSLPRLKTFSTPLTARISLLSQDWLNLSSYSERVCGLSLGLVSSRYHDLTYNLTWRTLTDRLRVSSQSIRRQLGHSLLSSFKYTFKIDRRDSHLRPTRGYAFSSSTEIGGVGDSKVSRFVRQELDLRAAVPLGFGNTALNLGFAAGAILPWGKGFMNLPTPVSERFYLDGHTSPFGTLGGPTGLPGFMSRGLGPTDVRRLIGSKSVDNSTSTVPGRDALGGDLAVTAFADLSFDLPLKLLREAGIHGHAFVSAGSLSKLSENEIRNFSVSNFMHSIRSSVGFGIVIPKMGAEINYCHILKKSQHDHGKTGLQFCFSL